MAKKEVRLGATLAAQFLGMGERGFYNLVERGDLPFSTVDGKRQFALSDLAALKAERAKHPTRRGRPRVQFTDMLTGGKA